MSSRKRVYSEAFLELGFTFIVDKGIQKPQCVVCNAILCKESMKASKLKDHLIRKHASLQSKPVDYFRRLEGVLKRRRLDSANLENVTYDQRDATKASLQVAWMIAQAREPHNIGEELIKPAAVSMASTMCGQKQADRLKLIPLSNNTIRRWIDELSNDIKDQLISRVKNSGIFAIQVEETTDVASDAQLMVYIRYKGEMDIEEDLLMCSPLETTTKSLDVFRKVDAFFNEPDVQLEWKNCVGITTDGSPSTLGVPSGFLVHVKKENPSVLATHCIIHRQALAVKNLQPDLEEVMSDVVKVINYIKSSALNSRLFSSLCGETDSEYHCLLYYAPTRWLSRGNVVGRVFHLKTEIEMFLEDKGHYLAGRFRDPKWTSLLCYLVDIFAHLNALNTSLQGPEENVVSFNEKIQAFRTKLDLWDSKLKMGRIAAFPKLGEFLEDNDSINLSDMESTMSAHLKSLHLRIEEYFPAIDPLVYAWVQNTFKCTTEHLPDEPNGLAEEIIEIKSSNLIQMEFNSNKLSSFWISLNTEFPLASLEGQLKCFYHLAQRTCVRPDFRLF